MSIGWRRLLVGGAVLSVLLAAGTVIAVADTGGVIFACVNNSNGDVRIVAQQVSCKPNETSAHWNVVGPQGPAGPQGPQGPAGPAGQQGPPGQSGPQQEVVGVVTARMGTVNLVFEAIQFTSGVNTSTAPTGGHAVIDPGSFTKVVDTSSPDLLRALTRGELVDVSVELCKNITMLNGAPKCSGTPDATYQYARARLTKISDVTPPSFTNKAEEEVTFQTTDITFAVDGHTVRYDSRTGITS